MSPLIAKHASRQAQCCTALTACARCAFLNRKFDRRKAKKARKMRPYMNKVKDWSLQKFPSDYCVIIARHLNPAFFARKTEE